MPRYAPKMSMGTFKNILVGIAVKNDSDVDSTNPNFEHVVYDIFNSDDAKYIHDDWKKVYFSTENIDISKFIMLHNSIPCMLLEVGGDWEHPIAAAVYHDGTSLRGYIPKKGNTYNYKTKSAFGNDEDSDDAAIFKQYGLKVDTYTDAIPELPIDWSSIIDDCCGRIVPKGEYTKQISIPKTKTTLLKEKHAGLEKNIDLSGPITKDMIYVSIHLAADGAYVEFLVRQSGRELTEDEVDRIVGIPKTFRKSGNVFYYNSSPQVTYEVLKKAGFDKCPNNDISIYAKMQQYVIYIG